MTGSLDLGIPGLDAATEIGRGGFSVVYRAVQPAFGREVAVKVLTVQLDERARERFARECQAMGTLSEHPAIATIHDAGFDGAGRPYLVMALMSGGSLEDRLERHGPMAWPDVVTVGVRMAGALAIAHEHGIIHRDVKPANLLMSRFGDVMLSDFGIARIAGGPETRTGVITASLVHAPPEIIDGQRPSEAADVYSLGSTLHTLITGRPPFAHPDDETTLAMIRRILEDPVPDLRPRGVPDAVCAVLERSMAKAPTDRFPGAAAFADALRAAGHDGSATPVRARAVAPPPIRAEERRSAPEPPTTALPPPDRPVPVAPPTPPPVAPPTGPAPVTTPAATAPPWASASAMGPSETVALPPAPARRTPPPGSEPLEGVLLPPSPAPPAPGRSPAPGPPTTTFPPAPGAPAPAHPGAPAGVPPAGPPPEAAPSPPRAGRPRWPLLAAGVVVAVLGAIALVVLLGGGGDGDGGRGALSTPVEVDGDVGPEPAEYVVDLEAGSVVRARAVGAGGLDPYVQIEDPDGTTIAEGDAGVGDGEALVVSSVATSGPHTVVVSGVDGSSGAFTLDVEPIVDETEASPIAVGEAWDDSIDFRGDRDGWVLQAPGGSTVGVTVVGDESIDGYLRVYDDDGALVTEDDDGGGGLTEHDPFVQVTMPASGSLYLEVAGYEDESTGRYTIVVVPSG